MLFFLFFIFLFLLVLFFIIRNSNSLILKNISCVSFFTILFWSLLYLASILDNYIIQINIVVIAIFCIWLSPKVFFLWSAKAKYIDVLKLTCINSWVISSLTGLLFSTFFPLSVIPLVVSLLIPLKYTVQYKNIKKTNVVKSADYTPAEVAAAKPVTYDTHADWLCPKCGRNNTPNDRFCKDCGTYR